MKIDEQKGIKSIIFLIFKKPWQKMRVFKVKFKLLWTVGEYFVTLCHLG